MVKEYVHVISSNTPIKGDLRAIGGMETVQRNVKSVFSALTCNLEHMPKATETLQKKVYDYMSDTPSTIALVLAPLCVLYLVIKSILAMSHLFIGMTIGVLISGAILNITGHTYIDKEGNILTTSEPIDKKKVNIKSRGTSICRGKYRAHFNGSSVAIVSTTKDIDWSDIIQDKTFLNLINKTFEF